MTRFSGVYAALLTPRDAAGALDLASFRRQIASPAADKLSGYAVGGATGEFTFTSPEELFDVVSATRTDAPSAQILAGIGAGDVRGTVARGVAAAKGGADAVLLPMPSFFPYRQDDLREYCTAVASSVPLPVVLYNLPQFTTGLDVDTVLTLLRDHDNIVGVKDSSGSLEIMQAITNAGVEGSRLIGNDAALGPAMEQQICDGVVSGVACALPELMTSVFAAKPGDAGFDRCKTLLGEFIDQLGALPTPWGLKVISAARGFTRESYPLPLSPKRQEEAAALRIWFQQWHGNATEKGAA